jgi:deoxyribonuclease-4
MDSTRTGLCIDTQHAFASGMCKFETHEDVVKLFDAASYILPRGISMIHLNDSTKAFGSHVDRHAPLRQGFIWGENDEGLRSVVTLSRDHALDLVSETKNPFQDAMIVQTYLDG